VKTQQRLVDVEMLEQLPCVACVLAGDEIYFAQDTQSAQSDIFEIAQRRGYQVDRAGSHRINSSSERSTPTSSDTHRCRGARFSQRL
jgi:hypothetical protein